MVTETVALRAGPAVAVAVTLTLYVPTIGFMATELPELPQPSIPRTSNISKKLERMVMRVRRLRPQRGISRTPARPKPEPASHSVCVDTTRCFAPAAEVVVDTDIASVEMFV